MANYLFRLWVHEAGDGVLPEVAMTADGKLPAAALALRHFIAIGRPVGVNSYLECEPRDGEGLRVVDVLRWLHDGGAVLRRPDTKHHLPENPIARVDPARTTIHTLAGSHP